jgi:hypothetical protein
VQRLPLQCRGRSSPALGHRRDRTARAL